MAAGTDTVVSLTSQTASSAIPVNCHGSGNIPIGIVLDLTTVSATATASAQFTFSDFATIAAGNAIWFDFPDLSGKSATAVGVETMPCTAVRLNVSAYTSGTVSMRVKQGVL